MKRGRPIDEEITTRILEIIRKSAWSIERIKRAYDKAYEDKISWNTIRAHVDILIEKGLAYEEIISDEGRKSSLIRIIEKKIITMNKIN
jgi:hypothetical protein